MSVRRAPPLSRPPTHTPPSASLCGASGEFPASFAVCFGQREILRLLAAHGAALEGDRDSHGNTCLHLAVLHSRPLMYDFLVDELAMEAHVLNAKGHTPLTLAASEDNRLMFTHILKKSQIKIWR